VSGLRRREFLMLLGGVAAAARPLSARAQQPAMPVVGFLENRSPDAVVERLRAFRQGLKDTGHVEGTNVAIEHRWADNQIDRLPALAAELVQRPVAVIVGSGGPQAPLALKAATTTIPIVFGVGEDPVRLGLVASLARPGGNATGVHFLNTELTAKRLELLRELVPGAARVAVLVNPRNATSTETTLRDVQSSAQTMGLQIQVLSAANSREIDAAFASLGREPADALFVSQDGFLISRRLQLANMAARHAIPIGSSSRDIAEVGGLMSYGTNITEVFRQMGVYTGRILKGARPADLPVEQSTKVELVINAQTARMLGLTVPPTLLALADEVIE
jgi:putative tryptophan/tyrosine transport system substrate-binding protein